MPNEKAGRNYGYVTPLFNIQRLKDTDETDVDFSFTSKPDRGRRNIWAAKPIALTSLSASMKKKKLQRADGQGSDTGK